MRFERCFARFHWVDDVVLDGIHVFAGEVALEEIDLRATHFGAFTLADELDALACRIGALVELAGKEFDAEDRGAAVFRELGVDGVGLRLAEHRGGAGCEELFGNAFHIVAIEQAQVLQSLDAKDRAQLVQQLLRFDIESGLLFNIDT